MNTAIAVMDEASLPDGLSIVKRLFQGIENELRPGRARHAPADDAPAKTSMTKAT